MNYQLIEKLIKANNQTCPQFTYSNPALDKNVTQAFSKCLLELYNKTRDNSNNGLRFSILETIRNFCTVQPSGHLNINENITELLINVYKKHVQDAFKKEDSDINTHLDAFLIRTSKEVSIKPHSQVAINPELIKALLNLNKEDNFMNVLFKEMIHWNYEDTKTQNIIKELWKQDKCEDIFEDLAIKVRSDIERLLLESTLPLLEDKNCNAEGLITSNNDLTNLINTCCISSNCFHMCISILNALLILGHFNPKVLKFIQTFVDSVKINCSKVSFSVLYPANLTHVTTLLNFDIDDVRDINIKDKYANTTLKYLNATNEESADNLIMLLSHFPQWFEYYFAQPHSVEL